MNSQGGVGSTLTDIAVQAELAQIEGKTDQSATLEKITQKLQENKGLLPLSDNSSPELIYQTLGISKRNFKKAVGMLYKEGKVELLDDGVRLKKAKDKTAPYAVILMSIALLCSS